MSERPEIRGRLAPSGEPPASRPYRSLLRAARRRPSLVASGAALTLILLVALFANLIAPHPHDSGDLQDRLAAPSLSHPLGTDKVGRDTLSRLMVGARQSVLLGGGAVLIAQALAALAGIASGYLGGWFDTATQRLLDLWSALPGLLFLIFVIGTVGPSRPVVLASLGLLLFTSSSRLMRAMTLGIKNESFVEAAQGLGASPARVILRHLLPNLLPLLAVQATLQLGSAILLESSLSFLGYGVPPPSPTWGRMLADARGDLSSPGGFSLALWPGLAITVVVFCLNMFGDGLHDLLAGSAGRR